MLSPDALPGGGGRRVRAHVLDSESGGAKGHYPTGSTRPGSIGSAVSHFFRACRIFSDEGRGGLHGWPKGGRLTAQTKGEAIMRALVILAGTAALLAGC